MDTQYTHQLLTQQVEMLQSATYDQLVVTAQMIQIAESPVLKEGFQLYQGVAQKHIDLLAREFGTIEHWSYTEDDVTRKAIEELRRELNELIHPRLRDYSLLRTMDKINNHKISFCEAARVHACALRKERAALLLFQAQHDETLWKQQWRLLSSRLEYSALPSFAPLSSEDYRTYAFG